MIFIILNLWKSWDFNEISNKLKNRSKSCTITIDTILESWDPKLHDEKFLGTILYLKQDKNLKIWGNLDFYSTQKCHHGTQDGTPMVPRMSNGTQMVPRMVPKWYPNFLTHFIVWSIFIILRVQKMAQKPLWPSFWVPSAIPGYHRWYFRKTYHVSSFRKNILV